MSEQFDAIVVGSGFGGAVAAARLAQAGHSVVVLERGRRWRLGEFPRRPRLDDGWLWAADRGLYDIRWLDRMASVQAAGWGGGSLVYANVFARPFDAALDERWPAHLRRDVLDPYYDLAAHMLGVAPVGDDPRTGRPAARTALIERMVTKLESPESTVRPNLAVTFGDPDAWQPNPQGVPRRGCAFVGECVIGCNHGAKNTLDVTYLAAAERAGARAVTDAEVHRIEQRDGGYAVTTRTPSDPRAPHRLWRAKRVVLAAGTVATNELLLRARDRDGTLPELSPRLGTGFSGNGDFLSIAELPRARENLSTGPTITTNTVLHVPEGRQSVWYQVQDGAVPPQLLALLDELLPGSTVRRWRARARGVGPRQTFSVLAMGRDSGNGTLRLDHRGEATLSWRNRWQAHLYRSQLRVGPLLARLLGARVSSPVTWSLLRRTVTVHPLGGVRPGPNRISGVVDEVGEVHGYPGLHVMDGSVLPVATGVNPSATILAAAERAIEQVIRRAGRPGWRAPEWREVAPTPVPEDRAFTVASRRFAQTRGNGVGFHERMATSPRARVGASVVLTAQIRSMARFLDDPEHSVALRGTIDVAGIVEAAAATGRLSLFPEGRREAMAYELRFRDRRGSAWLLRGRKTIDSRTPVGLLRGLTTLRCEVVPDGGRGGTAVPVVLMIGGRDLAGLGTSVRGIGFTRARRLGAAVRFAAFFARAAVRRRPAIVES